MILAASEFESVIGSEFDKARHLPLHRVEHVEAAIADLDEIADSHALDLDAPAHCIDHSSCCNTKTTIVIASVLGHAVDQDRRRDLAAPERRDALRVVRELRRGVHVLAHAPLLTIAAAWLPVPSRRWLSLGMVQNDANLPPALSAR